MEIIKVNSKADADACDKLLTKLINFESNLDKEINGNYVVSNFYERALNKDDTLILLAKENNEAVAFIIAYKKFAKGTTYNHYIVSIDGLFVEKKYRRKGIGKKLINMASSWAKEKYVDVCLEIDYINTNLPAEKLYKSLGFETIRCSLRKYL